MVSLKDNIILSIVIQGHLINWNLISYLLKIRISIGTLVILVNGDSIRFSVDIRENPVRFEDVCI